MKKSAAVYYQIPKKIERFIPSGLVVNGKVRNCIAKYGESRAFEESLNIFANRVETCLNTVVPEFGSITCSSAFLFDEPSIEQELLNVFRNDCSHIVAIPFYANFSCPHSGFILNETARILNNFTKPAFINGKKVHYERVVPNSSTSFHVSALHRWSSHYVVSEYWLYILKSKSDDFDSVVFSAPAIRGYNSKDYRRSVWSVCERVMDGLNDRFQWRLSFFNAWDQWNLPVRDSIKLQAKRLAAELPSGKRVAIVPITSLFPNFDTLSVLPSITQLLNKSVLIQPEVDNAVLLHGVVEAIKNHLLGRRNAQLRDRCNWCISKHCQQMRLMFDDTNEF